MLPVGSLVRMTESELAKRAIPNENYYHMAETQAAQIMLQAEESQRQEAMAQMREEALQREANASGGERQADWLL